MVKHPKVQTGRGQVSARRGATAVELAFAFPVILLFVLGIIEFGWAVYAYSTVCDAARAGARYAMVHGSMASSPVGPAANNGTVASTVLANAPALDPAKLSVTSTWSAGSNEAGCPVTVTATYNCQLIVGQLVGFGSFNVTGTSTMSITH